MLPDYIRGLLDEQATAGVEEHLLHCPVCRSELAEVKSTLASIKDSGMKDVPQSYFTSILPRVHRRLDQRRNRGWMLHPLVSKVALPLGAAIVASILVWRMPVPSGLSPGENSLAAVVDSATPEEIVQIVRDDIPFQDWSSLNTTIIARALTDDRFVQRELVEEALASDVTSPFNVFADVSPQQILSDFDEVDANEVLQRLGHKESL